MGTLVEEKMNFSHVQLELHLIRMIAYDEIKSRTTLATLIPRLFDTTGDRHRLGQEVQPQIGALTLSCDTGVIGVRNFERMCSALRLCQTTRKLSLDLSISPTAPYTSKIWWKWLAYSLFSKRARSYSTIDSVALILEEKVTVADMDALCAVLGSDFPEEELLGCSGGQVGGREATLEANTPIKWQMTKQGTPRSASKELRFSFPIPFVRTLRDDGASGWVDVIIPGLAWCQVQRSCLRFSVCEPQTLSSNNITSLSITFRTKVTSNAASLVRFLGAIGTTLKHLTIDGGGLEVDENVVLEKCPNLCTLSLRGKWFDAELDFSHYRGVGEAIPSIKCYQLDVRTLAGILGDNDEPLTKCLHRLRVHHERNKLTASALLQMLTTNETLAFLEIGGYLKMSNFDEFRQHHLEPIKRTRNISKESKLAFLSVLSSHQTDGQAKKRAYRSARIDGVMWNLDQYVLSKIFAFAGPPILRQVFCKIDHTYVQQQDVVNYYSQSDSEDDWDGFYLEFHRRPRSWEPYTFAHGLASVE
ncbi:hypothetical protein PHMEG_00031368 [Phytophthora megakarya]|uniref:Uncharacterized protein n=1 Tax=Phytophthora megakarya TaxID=4795 RepID=A0A225UXY3_9STRA|nr:hypothetical protein PHMEG_00031368 [Phytophthora megakarya]